jgi:hypothetical protein
VDPYLVTATDPHGRRTTFARDGMSPEHVRGGLVLDGFSDIEFEDDEFTVRLRRMRPDFLPAPDTEQLLAEARIRRAPPTAGADWSRFLKKNGLALFGLTASAAVGIWAGYVLLTAAAAGIVAWMFYHFVRWSRRGDRYDELMRAYGRGDWQAAEAMIPPMLADPLTAKIPLMVGDLRFRAAGLRARRGEVEAALADIVDLGRDPSFANGMYTARVGSIHYLIGDYPAFVAAMEAGCEAAGGDSFHRLDLAFTHARVGDPARARALLDGIDRSLLSTMHQPIFAATDALCRLRTGDVSGEPILARAIAAFSAFAGQPATWPIHGVLLAWHALILTRVGRPADALAVLDGWLDVALAWADADTRQQLVSALSSESST